MFYILNRLTCIQFQIHVSDIIIDRFFLQNVVPDSDSSCGPYVPATGNSLKKQPRYNMEVNQGNHDTIGMIVIDEAGNVAGGTTTNGANHKVPG